MRRIEPSFPDLFSITHVMRPGYLPGTTVTLDPIRMGIVWEDAPRRILPGHASIPRQPVRAMVFARVAVQRQEVLHALLENGSSVLLVLDDPGITPSDLGLGRKTDVSRLVPVLPVLPSPLSDTAKPPRSWKRFGWGVVLGLFPFPGATAELERRLEVLHRGGARFAVAAPLLLTPKDRHRILDGCDGTGIEDQLENSLFHADVARGLHALERRAGVAVQALGMEPVIPSLAPAGCHPRAVHTAALLRIWARRLDQSYEESSLGWRLRRAAAALEPIDQDPEVLAAEDNLRIIPGFDEWVEEFTRALWYGGKIIEDAWKRWTRAGGNGR